MFYLLIQLLTPLSVFALICVLIYEFQRLRTEQATAFQELNEAIRGLSMGVASLDPPAPVQPSANQENPDRSSGRLQSTSQQIVQAISETLREIRENQSRSESLSRSHQEALEAVIEGFSRQQAALERLAGKLNPDKPTERNRVVETPPQRPVHDDLAFLRTIQENLERPAPPPVIQPQAAEGDAKQRFDDLARWVHTNMQSVLQRSLSARSQPESLAIGAPTELKATAEIADGMVLLVGTQNYSEKLALVLPGSYIGARYYSWFEIPIGTNERVEDTIEPALVQKIGDDFVVIRRGAVRQT